MNVDHIHWLGHASFRIEDGKTQIYIDPWKLPAGAPKADVALMPCGGTYTMTASEMAEAANTFKPGVLIPMHWGDIVGSKADAETVAKVFKGKTVVRPVER